MRRHSYPLPLEREGEKERAKRDFHVNDLWPLKTAMHLP
jgi:hypothetical protein